MWQMMRADEYVTTRHRHVFRDLTLDREIALVRVRVFEVLLHMQRERKHWTKTRERLIVESLATELILRARGDTGRHDAGGANRCYWSTRRTDSSLKHLHGVEQGVLRRTAWGQNTLLLLHSVSDVRVERDREQRVIVEETEGGANRSLAIAPRIPRHRNARRPVVLVTREPLLHTHRILRGENLVGC